MSTALFVISIKFITTQYYVRLTSPTIPDLYFYLTYNMNGTLQRDSYESYILQGRNVLYRLEQVYRQEMDIIVENLTENPLFKDSEVYIFAMLISESQGGIDGTTLELNQQYDINEIGKAGGLIDVMVTFSDYNTSYEQGAMAIQEIKTIFDEANLGFRFINFYMVNEDGNFAYQVDFLPYEEIDSPDLAQQIHNLGL
ncbi:MAG: hypothetical protein ATN34_01415 [Epulopiscium sp. Nele67-Bin002]|nr:MAG: hypothetical protein ATN34_01415 [Epulopiscium sp. Nele67-Bin002]